MKTQNVNIEPNKIPFKCPVCNGFGTLKYGTVTCHACNGKGYVVINNKDRQTDEEKYSSNK